MDDRDASFERLDRWVAADGVELRADAGRAHTGTQSAKVTGGSGTLRFEPDSPLDLSGVDVSFAMDVERSEGTIVHLSLTDVEGNRTTFRSQYYRSMYPDGFLRYAPSVTTFEADLSQVATIAVSIDTGEGHPTYWIDDLRFEPKQFDTAKFVFTFDDIIRSQYETAYPILTEYGFTGSLAVNTDFIGEDNRLTLAELGEMDDAGWDLANHTHTHADLHDLSADRQREEIERPKEVLSEQGFAEPSVFYYPFGNADRTTLDIVADTHDMAYNAYTHWSTGLSPATPMSPYWTNRLLPREADPVKRRIDLAIEATAVCTPYWHTIGEDGEISAAEFEAICAYLAERSEEIDVVRPSRIISR